MKKNFTGLVFGILFGFWLSWTTFTDYDTIFRAFIFEDLYLWFMFGTALVASAIGLRLLRKSGAVTWIGGDPIGWKTCQPNRDHVIGSSLFGMGWALAGTCPGPAAVQVGQGHMSGLFTLMGIMVGIVLCDVLDERSAVKAKNVSAFPLRDEPAGT